MNTWLITGCSTGIGRGIALAALKSGDQVIVTARNTEKLSDFEENYPDTALIEHLDLTDQSSMDAAVQAGIDHFGNIDILVNNAGYGYRATIEESEENAVRQMFETNVFGPGYLMKAVLPSMRKQKHGIIINVASIGAVRAAVDNGYYSATKAALELISEAVAKETAHLGIQVMIVEPGAFRTHFYDSLSEPEKTIDDYTSAVASMRLSEKEVPHNQPGDPMKAGELIVRLAESGTIPKRLPLGSDAVKIVRAALEDRLKEIDAVEKYSIQTDF